MDELHKYKLEALESRHHDLLVITSILDALKLLAAAVEQLEARVRILENGR